MRLRDYQEQAINSLLYHLEFKTGNPCVVIPTAGGKTHVIAGLIQQCLANWQALRFCVVVHTKELIRQNYEKFCLHLPLANVGIYSAGLKQRDAGAQILFAGIQSIYEKSHEVGSFDVILIDEAHRIPAEGEGMYRSFLKDQYELNNSLKIVGLTATPYRMRT